MDYIAALEQNRTYSYKHTTDRFTNRSLTGAYGLGFSSMEHTTTNSVFERLFKALKDSYRIFVYSGSPAKAEEMLQLMESPEGFQNILESSALLHLPIFTAVVPTTFIARLLETPLANWYHILSTLERRFSHHHELFNQEQKSLQDLFKEIDHQVEALGRL